MAAEVIERCLLVKPEVFVYNIPPRQSARGYRAADWNLSSPNWTGRMRVVAKGKQLDIRLEDKTSGELFAACPVEQYPGTSVEAVTDSSRYFVVCVQDSGRKAYIGIGFADRADSFDLNVTLQDHFKYLKKEAEGVSASAVADTGPKLDLAFKAGQTIRINIPSKKGGGEDADDLPEPATTQKKRPQGVGGLMGLPPPPGGGGGGVGSGRIPGPPPGASSLTPMQSPSEPVAPPVINSGTTNTAAAASSNVDLLGDLLGSAAIAPATTQAAPKAHATATSTGGDDLWGDFESVTTKSSGNWTTF